MRSKVSCKKNPPKTKTHRDNTCHKFTTTWVLKLFSNKWLYKIILSLLEGSWYFKKRTIQCTILRKVINVW